MKRRVSCSLHIISRYLFLRTYPLPLTTTHLRKLFVLLALGWISMRHIIIDTRYLGTWYVCDDHTLTYAKCWSFSPARGVVMMVMLMTWTTLRHGARMYILLWRGWPPAARGPFGCYKTGSCSCSLFFLASLFVPSRKALFSPFLQLSWQKSSRKSVQPISSLPSTLVITINPRYCCDRQSRDVPTIPIDVNGPGSAK